MYENFLAACLAYNTKRAHIWRIAIMPMILLTFFTQLHYKLVKSHLILSSS